jgi:hypothetical protein
LDVLPSDLIYDKMFTFDEDNDEPLTPFFDQLGYSNISAIKNMGSAFFFLLFEVSLLIVVLPLTLIFR